MASVRRRAAPQRNCRVQNAKRQDDESQAEIKGKHGSKEDAAHCNVDHQTQHMVRKARRDPVDGEDPGRYFAGKPVAEIFDGQT